MPRVEHVALWVADVDLVCAFYERLGAVRGPLYENPTKGFRSHFLTWPDGGARLEVMSGAVRDLAGGPSLGWAHVAIGVGSEERVDELAHDLRATGTTVVDGPRRTGDGYYECVVLDPEGNRVELTA